MSDEMIVTAVEEILVDGAAIFEAGPPGPRGIGAAWYTGNTPPTSEIGANGDYYLQSDTLCIYGPRATYDAEAVYPEGSVVDGEVVWPYVGAILQGIVAENVAATPHADIASTNVQGQLEEIAAEKQSKTAGHEILYSRAGNIDVSVGTLGRIITRAGTLTSLRYCVSVPSPAGDTDIDIMKNGAFFTRVTLESGAQKGNNGFGGAPRVLVAGDVLTVNCVSAPTTPAKDLSITFLLNLA
jgi:hypothetical protein